MIQIVSDTTLEGVRIFAPEVFEDARGYFKETYVERMYTSCKFVQDNVSFSRKGVLRGLHGDPNMDKLVQCLHGTIYDVVVDMSDEPKGNKWEAFILSGVNHKQLFVPKGFAHGFLALTDDVVVSYKQTSYHNPETEFTLGWDDPFLKIPWPIAEYGIPQVNLSYKDQMASVRSLEKYHAKRRSERDELRSA